VGVVGATGVVGTALVTDSCGEITKSSDSDTGGVGLVGGLTVDFLDGFLLALVDLLRRDFSNLPAVLDFGSFSSFFFGIVDELANRHLSHDTKEKVMGQCCAGDLTAAFVSFVIGRRPNSRVAAR